MGFRNMQEKLEKILFFMLEKSGNRILFTSVFKLILLHLVCLPLSSFVLENCCYKNPLCTSLCLVYQITIINRLQFNFTCCTGISRLFLHNKFTTLCNFYAPTISQDVSARSTLNLSNSDNYLDKIS